MLLSPSDILDAQAFFPIHKARFFSSRRIELYQALLATQETGMPLYKGLEMLHTSYSRQGKTPYNVIAMVLDDAKKALTGGSKNLASAIKHWLPDNEAIQLASGEEAGRLTECLQGLISMTESKSKMMMTVIAELAEPILLLVLSINLLFQISQKIVPVMSRSHDLSQTSGTTYIMYLLAASVQNYGIYLLVLTMFFFFWMLWSLPRRGNSNIRMLLEKFPPWSIYKAIQGATFLLNVAIMLKSGIPLYRTLELMRQFASPWLKERVETTMFGLRQGRTLGVALANTEYDFPDKDVLPFLIVLSEQKDFERAINILAMKWIERTLRKVKGILTGVRVFLYVGIASLAYILFAGMTSLGSLQ
jgi:type II secretory pathway component PulF